MKKLIILSVFASLLFTECGRKKHSAKKTTEDRIEIVPFYRNTVMMQDLHIIDTNLFLVEKEEFLSKQQYENFKNSIWNIIRDPRSKIYADADHVFDPGVLHDKISFCDSIKESSFDAQGNETIATSFRCDSITVMDNLSRVEFYESWYLNTKTNLIEKETLGFVIYQYVKEKEAFKELFTVFKDEEARQKCKKYYLAD